MLRKIDVILLSGGRGTRFREITHDKFPKPLYKVNDIELIKYSIRSLDLSLVNNLIFAVDHHADMVEKWVETQKFPVKVVYSYQSDPGVFGAVSAALRYVECEHFLVSNTDEIREGLTLEDLLSRHVQNGSLATMALAPVDHLYRHRVIRLDENGVIIESDLRNPIYNKQPALRLPVNTGYVIFASQAAAYFDGKNYASDWSAIVDPLIDKGLVSGVNYSEVAYFNVGTPVELRDAINYYAMSRV
ncbi:sugar phosphate nucleotidyltransferase [Streptomyces caniscabiei]|uniref:nucleotidyltransferase family protein n=1 Tax=Streptomyces caniscabiei TaxID=2746961 RepID=UPI0029B128B5|nr:sugar phosphate nucleotidyltransferase [Streptomyces caniscabiei]MDX2776553.1 sugar phosphate nucleotidyltransferase [Streptomyces caniscabiei]